MILCLKRHKDYTIIKLSIMSHENSPNHGYNTRSKNPNYFKHSSGGHSSDLESSSDEDDNVLEYRKIINILNQTKRLHKNRSNSDDSDNYTSKKKKVKRVVSETKINLNNEKQILTPNDIQNPTTTNTNVNKISARRALTKMKNINTKKFIELLEEKTHMNDVNYFKDIMTDEQQIKALKDISEIMSHYKIDKPYRIQLLDSDIPSIYKAIAYKKINGLSNLEPGVSEFYKMKNWIDTFMQIPFGKYKNLPVTLNNNGLEECAVFMDNAKKTLDYAVYGMNDAKLQIMQLIGQWITNPSAMGTAIAIKGPMGTGKTTLVKDGISKVLGRDFSFMALGGATDSSFLEGHSYTYEGAVCGKIIDNIVNCKSMNPVFFFDELDKVSETPKGEEIIGILTHLTDTTQNSKFHDKYFSEIDFDLSKCLFIFSYNDESKISPILLDRMYRIQTKGYEVNEKIVIANHYLLPKIREQVCFNDSDILISDDVMKYIITHYTNEEQGIRNLKRCLEIIYTKLNLYRLMRPGTNMFEKEMNIEVKFPMTITNETIDKLIVLQKTEGNWKNMYI